VIKFKKKRQINMEFGVGGQLGFVSLKKKLSIKVAESNLSDLRELARRMKTISRNTFKRKYGNLLGFAESGSSSCNNHSFDLILRPTVKMFHLPRFSVCTHKRRIWAYFGIVSEGHGSLQILKSTYLNCYISRNLKSAPCWARK